MTRAFASKWFALLCLFAIALVVRIVPVVQNSFDGLYGQDAYAYFEYAREMFAALSHAQFPPPFWWSLGYPALLSASFLFVGINTIAAQSITLLCGALVAPAAYALAQEAAPVQKNIAGWVAGLICALSGQMVQSSVVIMSDAPALLWATIAAWLLLRYARLNTIRILVLASIATGMAVWTRWENLIFAGVWFAALLVVQRNHITSRENKLLHFGIAVMCVTLILVPQLLIQVSSSAQLAGSSWLEGWSPANFFARTFDNVDGHFEYALPVSIFYAQAVAHPAYVFVLLTPLLFLGGFLLLKRSRVCAFTTVLVLGWTGAMLIFLMGIPYENFRFSLGFLSPLAVLTGIGAGWLWTRWQARQKRVALTAWIAVALLVMLLWEPRVLAPVLNLKTRELAHARWLEQKVLPNAVVYAMSIDGALQKYTTLHVINLWDMEPERLDDNVPTYLYADTNNIAMQWRGKLPEQLLRALSESNELHPLDSFDGWTLYRVRQCKFRILDCE